MTTTETTAPNKRIITLTDRPPVKIREDEWPVIAHGVYSDHDNEFESQANRKWRCNVRVRQHADGRAIVYGIYDYDTAWRGERGFAAKSGALLGAGANLVDAINDVGRDLTNTALEANHEGFVAHISEAVRDCIADLPAEEI